MTGLVELLLADAAAATEVAAGAGDAATGLAVPEKPGSETLAEVEFAATAGDATTGEAVPEKPGDEILVDVAGGADSIGGLMASDFGGDEGAVAGA